MANMTLIEAKTLASSSATVIFSAIPQTYTDLVLVVSTRTDGAYTADTLYVTMNASTSNFSWKNVYGRGTGTVISQNNTNNELANAINGASSTSTTFSNVEIYIPNYRNTAHNKSITTIGSVENNAAIGDNYIQTILWNDTSSITSMTLAPIPGSVFVTNSTFYLYGIDAANDGAKATGGIISSDANYFYHVFASSGTFTPTQSINADVLCIAGGGGGSSGGGGAGGLRYFPSEALTATGYAVTVGAGGALGSSGSSAGSTGGDSQFGSLTLSNGGGGGSNYGAGNTTVNGSAGGSGGGGSSRDSTSTGTGGAASPSGQGNAGGDGQNSSAGAVNSGGGGGAGAVGGNTSFSSAGNGGNGSSSFSSWGSATSTGEVVSGTYYYAGGGRGQSNFAILLGQNGFGNGKVNTGGGGMCASSGGNNGFAGQSGIVIVRYAK